MGTHSLQFNSNLHSSKVSLYPYYCPSKLNQLAFSQDLLKFKTLALCPVVHLEAACIQAESRNLNMEVKEAMVLVSHIVSSYRNEIENICWWLTHMWRGLKWFRWLKAFTDLQSWTEHVLSFIEERSLFSLLDWRKIKKLVWACWEPLKCKRLEGWIWAH